MDYRIDHSINMMARHHPLLASIFAGFATWGVVVFAAAAVLLWFLAPPDGPDTWKKAGAAGLAGATLGLAVNQVIIHIWQRPRPYEAHPHAILPLLPRSTDPSFPSDHASAAFGIAIGVLLIHRRAGYLFLAAAFLIAVSRVATGMHYPTDVLAGAAIGATSGWLAARPAMNPFLQPLIRTVSVASDPVVRFVRQRQLTRRTLLRPGVRASFVLAVGSVLLVRFAVALDDHLFDELPLTALLLWAAVVLGTAVLAAHHLDPDPGETHSSPRVPR